MFSQDAAYLRPAWTTETTMPSSMTQFNNPTWEGAQAWGDDEVDVNSFFTLPASIDDPTSVVRESPVEPHQSMAEFYWSLAATQPSLGAEPLKPVTTAGNTWQQPYVAPLTPPEAEQFFSSDSGQSTPALDYAALSPVSSSNSSTTSKPAKKLLRTSTRKPSVKDEKKAQRPNTPAPNSKEAKLLRAKNCHNLVEKKYRNRLNNNFELLLTTVTELRKQQDANMEDFGFTTLEDDDNESLSSKGTGKTDLNGDKTMSKSDVLRLARETVLDLERKNKALMREVERLKEMVENSGTGYC
ncbi:hypothetical protein V8F20_005343 [Naviculisporaceae sp. PSN 640]